MLTSLRGATAGVRDAGPLHRYRVGLALLAAVVLLALGIVVGRADAPTRPASVSGALPPTAPVSASPPVATRSEHGAMVAGVTDVRALSSLYALTRAGGAAIQAAIAATPVDSSVTHALRLSPDTGKAIGLEGDFATSDQVVGTAAVLGAKVTAYQPGRATVAVWLVSVLGTARLATVATAFTTETLELVWQRDRWRVATIEDTAGPVPAATQSATPLADVVAATQGWTMSGPDLP